MADKDISQLTADPHAFFAEFDAIVLVANSKDAADVLSAPDIGVRPLFIFFNRVYRILDKRFERDCFLISRSSPVGASLVWRKEIDDVLGLLKGPNFHGILNVRAEKRERFSSVEEFKNNAVGFLDLVPWAERMYPVGRRMPSTGFALAIWLAQQKMGKPIYLSGFSGVRDAEWRVYDGHDWTWEQIVLHLFYKKGLLQNFKSGKYYDDWPTENLLAEFAEVTPQEFATTAAEVLSHRLAGTNRVIDSIFSSLRYQLAVRDFVRKLRPKSWKAKERARLFDQLNVPKKGE